MGQHLFLQDFSGILYSLFFGDTGLGSSRANVVQGNVLFLDHESLVQRGLDLQAQARGILMQALFLDMFSVVFRTLLHASTMSQGVPDIHGSSQIFPVSEGMSF